MLVFGSYITLMRPELANQYISLTFCEAQPDIRKGRGADDMQCVYSFVHLLTLAVGGWSEGVSVLSSHWLQEHCLNPLNTICITMRYHKFGF